jgi:hypothetical protein
MVEVSLDRKAVEIVWDSVLVHGKKVDIKCVNPDGGDVSTRAKVLNDGRAVVTFPKDYEGECRVTVTGSGGSEDSGMIMV